MAQQKVSDPAYTHEPVFNHLWGGFGREPDADSTVEVFDLSNAYIFEGSPNVPNEALLEVSSIVPLESELVVMGDGASHVLPVKGKG